MKYFTIAFATLIAMNVAHACNIDGGITYRHNSDPARESHEELYVFDGLGLSTAIASCDDVPVFIALDVHKQMHDGAIDNGDWRIDVKIGVQLW